MHRRCHRRATQIQMVKRRRGHLLKLDAVVGTCAIPPPVRVRGTPMNRALFLCRFNASRQCCQRVSAGANTPQCGDGGDTRERSGIVGVHSSPAHRPGWSRQWGERSLRTTRLGPSESRAICSATGGNGAQRRSRSACTSSPSPRRGVGQGVSAAYPNGMMQTGLSPPTMSATARSSNAPIQTVARPRATAASWA